MPAIIITLLLLFSPLLKAGSAFYCSENHRYINIGMTEEDVVQACGQPSRVQNTGEPVVQQIPVVQLVYANLNQGPPMNFYPGIAPVYQMFSLPSGSLGINIQVNLINNRVTSINVNNSNTNATNACAGNSFQLGDTIAEVYRACGNPSMINNTYITQAVSKDQNPEAWYYDFQYQPSVTLTFINGILQSIN